MKNPNSQDHPENKVSSPNRGKTQAQKSRAGFLFVIVLFIIGGLIIKLGAEPPGYIIIFIGVALLFRLILRGAGPPTSEELDAEIEVLDTEALGDKIIDDKLIKARYKRGLKYEMLYMGNSEKLESKRDFSSIYSAIDEYQWIIDNSNNEKFKKKAQKEIEDISKIFIEDLENADQIERRQDYAIILVKIGLSTIPRLKQLLENEFAISAWARYALILMGDKSDDNLNPIISAINGSETKDDRKAAILAVGGIGKEAKSAISEIQKAINDKDQEIRMLAAQALKKIK
jgi:hypothetical protein